MTESTIHAHFPFRLGTTSYIIPADILPNVRALAGSIDDIELVLFESDTVSNMPDEETIAELGELARENGLTYTVHFPLDVALCDSDEQVRAASVAQCKRIIDLVRPLDPFAYIVHCNEEQGAQRLPADNVEAWTDAARQSFGELSCMVDDPRLFAVETLRYPYRVLEDAVRDSGVSVCLDIGHLLLGGYSVPEHYDRYWDITRVIHLHGIIDGRDHSDLTGLDTDVLEELLGLLNSEPDTKRVLTLEIFSESDFDKSLAVLERYRHD